MSSQSRDYPSMNHSTKYRYSYLSYRIRDDEFNASGDGEGGVGPRITHSSSKKIDFGRYRYPFFSSQSHQIELSLLVYLSR